MERFIAAAQDGDVAELERVLAADVVSWADGGGQSGAGRCPVIGRDKVVRFAIGVFGHRAPAGVVVEVREINGEPAIVGHLDGRIL